MLWGWRALISWYCRITGVSGMASTGDIIAIVPISAHSRRTTVSGNGPLRGFRGDPAGVGHRGGGEGRRGERGEDRGIDEMHALMAVQAAQGVRLPGRGGLLHRKRAAGVVALAGKADLQQERQGSEAQIGGMARDLGGDAPDCGL